MVHLAAEARLAAAALALLASCYAEGLAQEAIGLLAAGADLHVSAPRRGGAVMAHVVSCADAGASVLQLSVMVLVARGYGQHHQQGAGLQHGMHTICRCVLHGARWSQHACTNLCGCPACWGSCSSSERLMAVPVAVAHSEL